MTFVVVNFDDAIEQNPVPNGRYPLQITECKIVKTGEKSKNPGRDQYRVSIGFPDNPEAPNLSHFVSLPHEDDDSGAANFKALLLKRFLVLFNVPFDNNGFDTEKLSMEMVGATATAEVQLTDPNENGDVYNRLVVPKLRGETETRGRAAPPSRKR